MKLASYRRQGLDDFGLLAGDQAFVSLKNTTGSPNLRELLASGRLHEVAASCSAREPDARVSEIQFLPVITEPRKILCAGVNYRDFAQQMGRSIGPFPGLFSRFADTLVGHQQPLVRPKMSRQFDYEGELAIIIGQGGRYIREDAALKHVAGYTCFVDGSVRDYQERSPTAGKNFPSTGSLGPWMVTSDEIPDPSGLAIETRLNSRVVQESSTRMMIHSVPALISYVSEITALQPGDIIATGTPGGVGHLREPQLWLQPGDTLEVQISGIGTLCNRIVEETT